jgi:hypothetical protein
MHGTDVWLRNYELDGGRRVEYLTGWLAIRVIIDRYFNTTWTVSKCVICNHVVVLGRFRESIPDDSILLAIFAGEREDSSKKSRNRFRLATSPKPKWAKKPSLSTQNWRKRIIKPRICQLFCGISHNKLAEWPLFTFSPTPLQFLGKISEIL